MICARPQCSHPTCLLYTSDAVDYCPVKFVKKPAGARPGMVTYDNYRTLYVTPEEGLAKKLFIR